MPSETEKGVIKPLAANAIHLIEWRLRSIDQTQSRVVLQEMHTCANCHSFSRDGRTFGMDMDGPQNDKGLYAVVSLKPQTVIRNQDMIHWNPTYDRQFAFNRVGFMSQVSPNGRYVLTMLTPGDRPPQNNYYVANFKDYRFLQVFYPTRGVLYWYDRATGERHPLPGADDSNLVQTNGVWSPDGKYIVFARAESKEPYSPGVQLATHSNDPNETQIRYDLYSVPFNGGQGGKAEPVAGASGNGMSNSFPKGFSRRPLDRLRRGSQRRVDAARQPALHRAVHRRYGAAARCEHVPDELLAQLVSKWALAGLFIEEPRAVHEDVSDPHRRRRQ